MNTNLVREDTLSQAQLQGGEIKSLSLIILGLFFIIHLLYAFWGPMNIMEGELLGTDGYTRLNRVQFIYEHGTWNNSIYPRSNAPYGESIHWTKPMDFLLLIGAGVFSMFLPFSTGLHLWGVIISPLLHLVAFLGLFCLMRDRMDRLGMILLAILFQLQPILTGYFMVGRPDHHSLILAIFVWFLVGLNWGLENQRNLHRFILTGFLGALGLWVSVEFLVIIGFFLAAYTLVWIWEGKAKINAIRTIMGSMFLFSVLFFFVERLGEDWLLIEYDRISLPHEMVLGLIFLVWNGIFLIGRKTTWLSTLWGRIGAIGIGSLLATSVQWYLFPGFFHGPLVDMDPAIRQLVWDHVAETQPLVGGDVVVSLGIGILALPFLAFRLRQEDIQWKKWQTVLLFIGAGIFIPLALYESRWAPYAGLVLLIPYVEYVRRTLGWVETRWTDRRGEMASLVFGLFLLFWPVTVGTVMAIDEPTRTPITIGGKCPVKPLADYLTVLTPHDQAPKTILAFKDFGPELLYRTSYRVIGTPMHRNVEGLKDMLAIMKATEMSEAEALIHLRDIDFIGICTNLSLESTIYLEDSGKPTFYETLLKAVPPKWLKEVPLQEQLKQSFRLFEVHKNRTLDLRESVL